MGKSQVLDLVKRRKMSFVTKITKDLINTFTEDVVKEGMDSHNEMLIK